MPIKDHDKKMERELEKMEESGITEKNKQLLREFDRDLQLNDYSKARRTKLINKLRLIAENNDIDFKEATKGDIEDIILWLKNRTDICETTKLDYKIVLKRFYRWIGGGEHPDNVAWIKTTDVNGKGKLPEDMLTEEDVTRLIESAKNLRDKAFISVLWETGARIGELYDLTVGSLKDHKRGYQLVVSGKTGSRRLLLIESVPHIRRYLESHPHKDNKEGPLWVNVGEGYKTKPGDKCTYRALTKALVDIGKRVGIEKPLNPHHFRHSRATYLANRFTEAQMCQWFGWTQGSKMPGKYVHMSGRDIDSAYSRIYGITDGEPEMSKMSPKNCPRCNESVGPEAQFCYRCGMALSIESIAQIEEEEEQLTKDFPGLAQQDPQLYREMGDLVEALKFFKENKGLIDDFKKMKEGMEADQKNLHL